MKKLISITIALTALTFSIISCGSDDDDDSSNSTCITCVINSTISVSTEYCDNGDSTMTVSLSNAPAQTIDIPGGNFDTFITGVEAAGASCN